MISAEIIPFKQVGATSFARKLIEETVRGIGEDALADFERIVEPWTRKPTFKLTFSFTRNKYSFTIVPEDNEEGQIFEWLDFGTSPHIIRPVRARTLSFTVRPVRARTLSFTVPYRAATRPHQGRVASRRARRGTQRVFAKQVRHPGFDPRDFSIAMLDYWAKEGLKRLNAAMDLIEREIGPI